MKICISACGKDPDSEVDPQFGRCNYFLVIDPDAGSISSIKTRVLKPQVAQELRQQRRLWTQGGQMFS